MTGLSTFWGLTRFNLRHLLTSPVFWALMPLALAGVAYSAYQPELPTWADLIDQARLQILALALVMFAITTFPAMREVRHSAGFALVLSSRARLLSLALAAVIVMSGCVAVLLGYHLLSLPVPIAGTASPYAVLSLFVLGWLGPLAAVTSATWTRSYAPLVLLALLVPAYLLYTVTSMGTRADVILQRLTGVASWVMEPLPIRQPAITEVALISLLHTLLLAGGLLMLALAARAGLRDLRLVSLGTAGMLLAGLFAVGIHVDRAYTYDTPFTDRHLYGAEPDPCRVREGVTYCPLPGYESWVDYWHSALGPSMAQVPERARDRIPVVWQGTENLRRDVRAFRPAPLLFPRENPVFPPRGTLLVYDHWETDTAYFRDELAFSGTAAVLGLPGYHEPYCTGAGQARLALGAWMSSVDGELTRLETLSAAETFLETFAPSALDVRVAYAVIGLPEEQVAAVVDEHWELLLSPDTGTEEFAELLDLPLTGTDPIPQPSWGRNLWSEDPDPDHYSPWHLDHPAPTCR